MADYVSFTDGKWFVTFSHEAVYSEFDRLLHDGSVWWHNHGWERCDTPVDPVNVIHMYIMNALEGEDDMRDMVNEMSYDKNSRNDI